MSPKCKYSGCEYDALNDQAFCSFHAPADEKKMTVERFNLAVFSRLKTGKYNFDGYVFPGLISFENTTFIEQPTFKKAVFPKGVKFRNANFKKGVDFSQCEFREEVDYIRARFRGVANFHASNFIEATVRFDSAVFEGQAAGFHTCNFYKGRVLFLDTKFACERVDFTFATFTDTAVDFSGSDFATKSALFANAKFRGGSARWNSAKFSGTKVDFSSCELSECSVSFAQTEFACLTTQFDNAVFARNEASFHSSRFTSGDVTFVNTQFNGTLVDFSAAHFYGDLRLLCNVIGKELRFIGTRFKDGSAFYLSDPIFKRFSETSPRIVFFRVRFNPFLSFFEGVQPGSDFVGSGPIGKPILLFRYSLLKDVYFANNDMALFSFYNSSFFEEAHFISGRWINTKESILGVFPFKYFRFNRANQIIEEQLFETAKTQARDDPRRKSLREYYGIELLETYWHVADLYLRFKAAADRGKNYHLASWFYFNEFEMKRRHLKDQLKTAPGCHKLTLLGRLSLYSFYKLFAGYGETPRWSLVWFVVFGIIFTFLHLFNGIQVPARAVETGKIVSRMVNYDWAGSLPNMWQFIRDFFYAGLFTLYRIIPLSYLPGRGIGFDLTDYGFWDLALSLSNAVVLILMIIFMGVGVKRHFRRF